MNVSHPITIFHGSLTRNPLSVLVQVKIIEKTVAKLPNYEGAKHPELDDWKKKTQAPLKVWQIEYLRSGKDTFFTEPLNYRCVAALKNDNKLASFFATNDRVLVRKTLQKGANIFFSLSSTVTAETKDTAQNSNR